MRILSLIFITLCVNALNLRKEQSEAIQADSASDTNESTEEYKMVSAGKVEPEEIDSVCQGFVLDQHEVARLQKSRLWLHKKNSEEVNDYICRKICGGRFASTPNSSVKHKISCRDVIVEERWKIMTEKKKKQMGLNVEDEESKKEEAARLERSESVKNNRKDEAADLEVHKTGDVESVASGSSSDNSFFGRISNQINSALGTAK